MTARLIKQFIWGVVATVEFLIVLFLVVYFLSHFST